MKRPVMKTETEAKPKKPDVQCNPGRVDAVKLAEALKRIRHGTPVDASFISSGLSREQFERYLSYNNIRQQIERSQAEFISLSMEIISRGGKQSASRKWQLERLFPSEFSRPSKDLRKENTEDN